MTLKQGRSRSSLFELTGKSFGKNDFLAFSVHMVDSKFGVLINLRAHRTELDESQMFCTQKTFPLLSNPPQIREQKCTRSLTA